MCHDAPHRVLLVDDDEDTLAMYAFGLGAAGFEVLLAHTAAKALALACAHQPHIVIMDARLPDVAGAHLANQLASDPRTCKAGVIMVSGDVRVERHALEAGCARFFLKPCLPDVLASAVTSLLAARAGDVAARPSALPAVDR